MSNTVVYLSSVEFLNDKSIYEKFYGLMPNYRKEKIDRYIFIKDKILSLGAGILLKNACIELGLENADENIIYNEYGKPLFGEQNYYFSISHSNKMVMCAVSTMEVGCDIEQVKELSINVSKKVFTENEIKNFNTNDTKSFYTLWTLKESYLKKLGKGFNLNPLSIEINSNMLSVADDKKTKLITNEINGYTYSCAYETDDIIVKEIDLVKIRI